MCSRKPYPRCASHSKESLAEFYAEYPSWEQYSDAQLRGMLNEARARGKHSPARALQECLDLRLDLRANRRTIKAMAESGASGPNATLEERYQYLSAKYTFDSRVQYTAHQDAVVDLVSARDPVMSAYSASLERLARLEGTLAATLELNGALTDRQLEVLNVAYDHARDHEAALYAVANDGEPDHAFISEKELAALRAAQQGAADGVPLMREEALRLASLSYSRKLAADGRYIPDADAELSPIAAMHPTIDALTCVRLSAYLGGKARIQYVPDEKEPAFILKSNDHATALDLMEHGYVFRLGLASASHRGIKFGGVKTIHHAAKRGALQKAA